MTVTLITCSFSGDLEACRLLCASVDRFAPDNIAHILYVPRRDMPLFAEMATPRRTLAAQEDLLPRWFWKAPLPSPKWRARLNLPRRNLYLTPFSPPVRGWIAQQIMKIAATLRAPTDVVAHVDSDNVFVRPLGLSHFIRDGRVRFYADSRSIGLPTHKAWYAAAGRLLGLPPADFYSADYVGQFVVWRRSVVEKMVAQITTATRRDWRVALARTPHFAEYVLYGVFVERMLGVDVAGLFIEPRSLCHSRWEKPFADEADESAFVSALPADAIACVIQSTIAMPPDERARVFARVTRFAEEEDAKL